MRTHCKAQATLFNALWWPNREGHPKKRGYMYMYYWFTLLYSRNKQQFKATICQQKLLKHTTSLLCARLNLNAATSFNQKQNRLFLPIGVLLSGCFFMVPLVNLHFFTSLCLTAITGNYWGVAFFTFLSLSFSVFLICHVTFYRYHFLVEFSKLTSSLPI